MGGGETALVKKRFFEIDEGVWKGGCKELSMGMVMVGGGS